MCWRSWSCIMLWKPEVAQYDRNKVCSCYHQRPCGCWIKMFPVGKTGIPCRLIVPPQGECVFAFVSFLYLNKVDTQVSATLCSRKRHFNEYQLHPAGSGPWVTLWETGWKDRQTRQRQTPTFTSWTWINGKCVWAEWFSRPFRLSLSCVFSFSLSLSHTEIHRHTHTHRPVCLTALWSLSVNWAPVC